MSPRDRHSQDLWVATWTGTLQLGGQQETKQFMTKCAAGYKVESSRPFQYQASYAFLGLGLDFGSFPHLLILVVRV